MLSALADDLAREVASRLSDQPTLSAAIDATARHTTLTSYPRWRPHTVAGGFAGTAILFGAADARWPGEGWDLAGHRHLAAAVAATEAVPGTDVSLYTGLAGIGFAAQVLAGGRDRYRRLVAAVDAELLPALADAITRLAGSGGGPVSAFDLISGLTGAGIYLLTRRSEPAPAEVLDRLLATLARLLADDSRPRRWHTPSAFLSPTMRGTHPHGNLNCGLAHGLPGPLALLAVARLEGVRVDGMAQGMARAARWLVDARIERDDGPDWPNAVGLAPAAGPNQLDPNQLNPGRPDPGQPVSDQPDPGQPDRGRARAAGRAGRAAWCYGAPGVARSLWLAGAALDDPALRELAVRTMRAVLARPTLVSTPTFCHGAAGLLQIVAAFARDTALPEFVAATDQLAAELADQHEPACVVGYRDIEASGTAVASPTLLDGAAGVALALLGAHGLPGGVAGQPPWQRLFLLT